MNTGSIDERKFLTDVASAAASLRSIARSLEKLAAAAVLEETSREETEDE